MQQLQDQVAALKRSLAAARQHQPGRAAPATAAAEQHFGQARYAGGAGEPAAGGPRHRPRRLAGSAAAQQAAAAEAAAEEEDPLLRSYDVLGMRQAEVAGSLLRPQRAQQAQQAQPRGQAQQQPAEPAAAAAPDCDDDLVVLDGSEEQEGEEGEELELEAEDNDSAPAQQAQQASQQAQQAWQQQQQAWQQQQQQQSRTQQTAAGPAPVQQRQQQAAPSSSSLGKRPAAAPAAPPQPAARSGGSQGADENVSGWAVPPAPAPLLATAGPGRAALQQGPGRSFIRNPAAAGIGLDRGRFISSGPDGKGGVVKAYLGSGAAPVRVSCARLGVPAEPSSGRARELCRGHTRVSAPCVPREFYRLICTSILPVCSWPRRSWTLEAGRALAAAAAAAGDVVAAAQAAARRWRQPRRCAATTGCPSRHSSASSSSDCAWASWGVRCQAKRRAAGGGSGSMQDVLRAMTHLLAHL